MKKTIFPYALILLMVLGACETREARLARHEKEYAALFDEEYEELMSSERYKLFQDRYNTLLTLTEEMSKTDTMPVHPKPIDKLCFKSPNDYDVMGNGEIPKKIKTFEDYTNNSKDVNAIIVNSQFFDTGKERSEFDIEADLHAAHDMMDKTIFLENRTMHEFYHSDTYAIFCENKLLIDRVNHSKYIVIIKELKYLKAMDVGLGTFLPGYYLASIYVYNIADKEMQFSKRFIANNSENISGGSKAENAFEADLNKDINKQLKSTMDKDLGLHGDFPEFRLWGNYY